MSFFVRTLTLPKVKIVEAHEMQVADAGVLMLFRIESMGKSCIFSAKNWISCELMPDDALHLTAEEFEERQIRGLIEAEKRAADIRHSVYPERYAPVYPVIPSQEPDKDNGPLPAA